MKKIITIVMSLVLVLGLGVAANASTSKFMGKGNVQLALNMNNAQLQASADSLVFSYETVENYTVTEYWENATGQGKINTHTVCVQKTASVSAIVTSESRKNSQAQVTGFNLNVGDTTAIGTVPQVGDALTGNRMVYDDEAGEWITATIIAVDLTSSTGGFLVNGTLIQ